MSTHYTDDDTRRVLNQDTTDLHQHFARLAAQRRDAVRQAIQNLRAWSTTAPR